MCVFETILALSSHSCCWHTLQGVWEIFLLLPWFHNSQVSYYFIFQVTLSPKWHLMSWARSKDALQGSSFSVPVSLVFHAMWLSWCSLNPRRLTELLERHKAERLCLLSPHLSSYSQLCVGSTNYFALSPPSPNTLSLLWCLGPRNVRCFIQMLPNAW